MKIIDEFSATMHFKHDMLMYAVKNWSKAATEINDMLKLDPPLPTGDFADFDFFLAILFIDSRAPYNLFGHERGERIWQYLINTFSVEKQYGDSAIQSLELYLDVWNKYSAENLNPVHAIVTALLYKLGYEVKDTDILLGTMLTDILIRSPNWWKQFSEKNKLEASDVPLDIVKFKVVTGESSMSYGSEIKDKEKLTKVLIKGSWEGIKEDYWDIEDQVLKKFADSEGTVYVMCTFKNGEPEYHYLNKKIWDDIEKVGEIINNPQLSEEEKKDQIDKLEEVTERVHSNDQLQTTFDIICDALRVQIDLATPDEGWQSGSQLESKESLGYIFGFVDGFQQAIKLLDMNTKMGMFVAVMITIFGEHKGNDLAEKALKMQRDRDFDIARIVGGQQAVAFIRDKTSPMGLSHILFGHPLDKVYKL